jgi:hypothetical protein
MTTAATDDRRHDDRRHDDRRHDDRRGLTTAGTDDRRGLTTAGTDDRRGLTTADTDDQRTDDRRAGSSKIGSLWSSEDHQCGLDSAIVFFPVW